MTIIGVIEFYNRNLWLRIICHVVFWAIIIISLRREPIYVEDYQFQMITFYAFSFLLYKKNHIRKLILWFGILVVLASVAATVFLLLPKVPGVLDSFSWPEKIFAVLNFSLLVYIMPSAFILSIKLIKYDYEINYRNAALNKSKSELELAFLKSQLSPHFLFNSLNNIYSLVLKKDPSASTVITKLTSLMEFTLKDESETFTLLSEELSFLLGYVDLEKIRHSEKVSILFDCPPVVEAGKLTIASFILLPFVENAFKHGVNNIIGKSWVHIRAGWSGKFFTFSVENNYEKKVSAATGGIGMKNSVQRLNILYPGKHELNVSDSAGVFSVNLKIELR